MTAEKLVIDGRFQSEGGGSITNVLTGYIWLLHEVYRLWVRGRSKEDGYGGYCHNPGEGQWTRVMV